MHASSPGSGIQMAILWHLCHLFVSLCENIVVVIHKAFV